MIPWKISRTIMSWVRGNKTSYSPGFHESELTEGIRFHSYQVQARLGYSNPKEKPTDAFFFSIYRNNLATSVCAILSLQNLESEGEARGMTCGLVYGPIGSTLGPININKSRPRIPWADPFLHRPILCYIYIYISMYWHRFLLENPIIQWKFCHFNGKKRGNNFHRPKLAVQSILKVVLPSKKWYPLNLYIYQHMLSPPLRIWNHIWVEKSAYTVP